MFDHNCPVCAKRVLVFPSQVSSLANTADGIRLTFTCWCGTEQTRVTGNAGEPAPAVRSRRTTRRTPVAA